MKNTIATEEKFRIFAAYLDCGFKTTTAFEGMVNDYKPSETYAVSPTSLLDMEIEGSIATCKLVLVPLSEMTDVHKIELWNYIFPEDSLYGDGTKVLNAENFIRITFIKSLHSGVRTTTIMRAIAKLTEWHFDVGWGPYPSLIEAGIGISAI